MNGAKPAALLVGGILLAAGVVNMAAEAVTGKPLLDGGVGGEHTNVADTLPAGKWTMPVPGRVTTKHGVPGDEWISGHHTGIDFPVRSGTEVKAASTGTVVEAGDGGQYGKHIVIKHADGVYTEYAHLSTLYVKKGAQVKTGWPIALSGNTGNSTGPHLHFEVRNGPDYGDDIDPLAFLGKRGVKP